MSEQIAHTIDISDAKRRKGEYAGDASEYVVQNSHTLHKMLKFDVRNTCKNAEGCSSPRGAGGRITRKVWKRLGGQVQGEGSRKR